MMMSFWRPSSLRNLQRVVRQQVRGFHMDTQWMDTASSTRTHHHQDGSPEILYDMISSGTLSSTERINKFMNTVYVKRPRSVSLFSFTYRQQTERSTIRGVKIGTNNRRGPAQKNVVVVSGLPLQDPSLIGVGLYVAAVLSRLSPALTRDISVIPLANPKEYEKRWRSAQVKEGIRENNKKMDLFSPSSPFSSSFSSPFLLEEEEANWIPHENLDLKDTCKPIETYVTRKNKYFINLEVDLTSGGSSMSYKGNSLSSLASKGKFRDFFSNSSSPSLPLPSSLFPSLPSSSLLIPEENNSKNINMLSSILSTPSIVLELKGKQSLDDEQVVARGEEIISLLKELMANN